MQLCVRAIHPSPGPLTPWPSPEAVTGEALSAEQGPTGPRRTCRSGGQESHKLDGRWKPRGWTEPPAAARWQCVPRDPGRAWRKGCCRPGGRGPVCARVRGDLQVWGTPGTEGLCSSQVHYTPELGEKTLPFVFISGFFCVCVCGIFKLWHS